MAAGRSLRTSKFLVCAALSWCVLSADSVTPASASVETCLTCAQVLRSSLQDGDVIFRRGRDMLSRLVMSQGEQSRFSHVGILFFRSGEWVVVHAMPEEGSFPGGVVEERLSDFVDERNAADAAVYRLDALDAAARETMSQYAFSQIGKPFDRQFRLSDDAEIYCTELAIDAYSLAGIRLVDRRAGVEISLLPEPVVPPDHLRKFTALRLVDS